MQTGNLFNRLMVGTICGVMLAASGCGDTQTTGAPQTPPKGPGGTPPAAVVPPKGPTGITPPAPNANAAAVSLTGGGSSFAYPMYSKWIAEFQKTHPNEKLNYASIGSGAGIKNVTEGTLDFGGTDGPMTDDQMAAFKAARGCNVLHLPTALGAVVPTYKIEGLNAELNFTPEALAGIYLGKITKWNDPALATANPGVKLPDAEIAVVHRSDGSGTTYTFTDYLCKVNAEWKDKVGLGTTVKWPTGLGGKGTEGVMGMVNATPNSLGYVELTYAIQNNVPYGRVKNAAGKFVKADLASTSAAAASVADTIPADFRVSITNAPGDTSYPIVTFTWIMIGDKITDPAKKAAMVEFLEWGMGSGQELLEPLSYARVPKEVLAKEVAALAKIQ